MYLKMTDKEYFAIPALNFSVLKNYLKQGNKMTPADLFAGPNKNVPNIKNAIDLGSAFHDHVLLNSDITELINRFNFSDELQSKFNSLINNYKVNSSNTFDPEKCEVVIISNYKNLRLKGKIDFIEMRGEKKDKIVIGDIKTVSNSKYIQKNLKEYMYWEQLVFYQLLHRFKSPRSPVVDFKLIWVSKDPEDEVPCTTMNFRDVPLDEQECIVRKVGKGLINFFDNKWHTYFNRPEDYLISQIQ